MYGDMETRLRDIKRRIDEIRSQLLSSQQQTTSGADKMDEPLRDVEQSTKTQRNTELDALKAKLMSKKS